MSGTLFECPALQDLRDGYEKLFQVLSRSCFDSLHVNDITAVCSVNHTSWCCSIY